MSTETKVYGYRWAVLLVFGLVFMIGQMMWLVFSLIRNEVTPVMGLTPADEPLIVLLTASQPLAFIVLSIPVGMLADRKGLVTVAGMGAILQTVFGTLRIFVIGDFWLIFACQFGLSVGSVMVQNCITYLSVNWFPRAERAVATGVSTLFMVLGMLLGTALSQLLWQFWGVPFSGEAGFTVELASATVGSILFLDAALAAIITIAFFAIARNKPAHPPDIEVVTREKPNVRGMLRDRNVWIVAFGFFAGFGVFIGLTAILEPLMQSLDLEASDAAIVMILLLAAGIFGAIVLPAISDKIQKRKPLLVAALCVACVTTLILGTSTVLIVTFVVSALLGFFLISVMPIALTTLEELKTVGPRLSGASAGIAFELGNLGGFLGSIVLELLVVGTSYLYSIMYLVVALVIATVLVLMIPETGGRKETQ